MGSLPSGAQLHILISDVLVGKGRPAAEFWLCKSSMSAQCTADKTEKSCTGSADPLLFSQTAARPISTTRWAQAAV